MAHTTIKLGNKHVNVTLDALRSYLHDADKIINQDPETLNERQLKIYNRVKPNQEAALEASVRIVKAIKPKHKKKKK